jgi:hypothetical protein
MLHCTYWRQQMIALAVYLNGKKLTVAGAEDLSVLNAIVSAVGELGKSTAGIARRRRSIDLHLSVGGLTQRANGAEDEHLRWISLLPLKVGDKVSVRLVRTDRPSEYQSAHSAGGNMQKINEKKRKLWAARRKQSSGSKAARKLSRTL